MIHWGLTQSGVDVAVTAAFRKVFGWCPEADGALEDTKFPQRIGGDKFQGHNVGKSCPKQPVSAHNYPPK